MQWKFLAGASFLTAALLWPHARPAPILSGITIAAIVQWGWSRLSRH